MAKKSSQALSDVLAETRKERPITTEEASVLAKLGMSGADVNEKARRVMTRFLEHVLKKGEVEDDEARACVAILEKAAVAEQKNLCNRVLAKYVSKFDAQPKNAAVAA